MQYEMEPTSRSNILSIPHIPRTHAPALPRLVSPMAGAATLVLSLTAAGAVPLRAQLLTWTAPDPAAAPAVWTSLSDAVMGDSADQPPRR